MSSGILINNNSSTSGGVKIAPSGKSELYEGTRVTTRKDAGTVVTILNGSDTLEWGVGPMEIAGYWSELYPWTQLNPNPSTLNGGSISHPVVYNGLIIRKLFISDTRNVTNQSADALLNIGFEGSGLPDDFISHIELLVGSQVYKYRLKFANKSSTDQNQNITNYYWEVPISIWNAIKSAGGFKVRFPAQAWQDTILLIGCEEFTRSSTARAGYENLLAYGPSFNYSNTAYNKGALLNSPNTLPQIVSLLSINSTSLGNPTTDSLQLTLKGSNLPSNSWGSIRFRQEHSEVGVTPNSSTKSSDSNGTQWDINFNQVSREASPIIDGAYLSNTKYPIKFDARAFSPNRSMTLASYDQPGINYYTKYVQVAYSEWGAGGSISNRVVNGRNVFQIIFVDHIDHEYKAYLSIGVEGNTTPEDWIDYVEFDGLGRFYLEDAHLYRNTAQSADQYSWHISKGLWSSVPLGQSIDIQFFHSNPTRNLNIYYESVGARWKGYSFDGVTYNIDSPAGTLENPAIDQNSIIKLRVIENLGNGKYYLELVLNDPNHIVTPSIIKSITMGNLSIKYMFDGTFSQSSLPITHAPNVSIITWEISQSEFDNFPTTGDVSVIID